jgi:hypothetical protein
MTGSGARARFLVKVPDTGPYDAARELLAAASRSGVTPVGWSIPLEHWQQIQRENADNGGKLAAASDAIDEQSYLGLPVNVAPVGSAEIVLEGLGGEA